MAKQLISMYWSEETLAAAETLIVAKRTATNQNVSRTEIVEELVQKAAIAATSQLGKPVHPQKRIEPVIMQSIVGRKTRERIIGWKAFYGDHLVIETDGAGSKPQAEQALDKYVWEELNK